MAPKLPPRPVEIVRDATLVHGGSGPKGRPWIPNIEEIGGKEFVVVDKGQPRLRAVHCRSSRRRRRRRVARLLGYDMHSGNPMQGATWVLHLTGLRDAEVTALIDKNKPKDNARNSHMCCACASRARDRSCWGGAREPCSR